MQFPASSRSGRDTSRIDADDDAGIDFAGMSGDEDENEEDHADEDEDEEEGADEMSDDEDEA